MNDASPFELVVLDPAGRVRFGHARTAARLADGDVICLRAGGLAAADRGGRAAIERLVSTLLADARGGGGAVPRVVAVPRAGRLPLVAVGLPIDGGDGCELAAAILLRDPEVVELPPAEVLRRVFALTPAEAEVALALGADRGLKEIAERRGCSVNTVRTLVGRVFDKTGCRRQAEVVRVIAAVGDVLAAGAGFSAGISAATSTAAMQGRAAAVRVAASRQLQSLLDMPLRAPPDQHATIVSRGFAPGDDTGFHLHGCGHEIVCVLEGALTMEYADAPPCQTAAGEAIYVPPGVAHRGVNAGPPLALFHIGIGPAGSIDRRDL